MTDSRFSEQDINNQGADRDFNGFPMRTGVVWVPAGNTAPAKLQRIETEDLALRVDDTTTVNVTYIGWARPGEATSSAVWKIKKIDETTGVVVTWADGDTDYNNVWDNRASLTYS